MARVRRKSPKNEANKAALEARVDMTRVDQREALFVEYLLADRQMSVVNAYRRAGYASEYARKNAYQKYNEPHIQEALRAAQEDLQKRIRWEQDDIMSELQIVAQSDVRDFVVDDAGNLTLREGAPDEAWRAVSKVKHKTTIKPDGSTVREIEFAMWDKVAANKAGGDHLGMFVKKIEAKIDSTVRGGVLVVPGAIDEATWSIQAEAQQRALEEQKRALAEQYGVDVEPR